MAIRKRYSKDPNATLDYTILWASEPVTVVVDSVETEFIRNDGGSQDTGWLQGDTIVEILWIADEGIEIESYSFTATYASVWLSGGDLGKRYTVTNRITTALGRVDDRSFIINCEQR